MGYFDFLSSPRQDTAAASLKRKRPPPPESEAGMVPFPKPEINPNVGPRTEPEALPIIADTPAPPDTNVSRNAILTEISNLREKVADEILGAGAFQTGSRGQTIAATREGLLRSIRHPSESGSYAAVSRDAEKVARQYKIDPSKIPSFMQLANAVERLKRFESTPAAAAAAQQGKASMAQTDLPQIEARLKALEDEKLKILQDKAFAPTEQREKELAKKEETLAALSQGLTKRKQEAELSVKSQQPPSAHDDIDKGFQSAGIDRKNQAAGVNDAEKELQNAFGPDFNLDSPVAFTPGLQQAIKILDPSGELEKQMAAALVGNTQQGPANQPAGKEASQSDLALAENTRLREQAAKDLADAEEMQSWPSIIAFVLLSFAIGPQMAFVFFSNAKKKGTLKNYIAQLDAERKELLEQQRFERDRDVRNREFVARTMMSRQAAKEDIALRMQSQMQVSWAKAAMKATTDTERKYIDGLKAMFSRKMQLAKYYQFNMNDKLASKYLEEAEDIADELDGLAEDEPGAAADERELEGQARP